MNKHLTLYIESFELLNINFKLLLLNINHFYFKNLKLFTFIFKYKVILYKILYNNK
jgi:hypothetical protein